MMAIVEHERLAYPSFGWGKDLTVKVCADRLLVSAVRPVGEEEIEAVPDVFRAYRSAVRPFGPQKREGKNSPHIQFANADTDQKLISFVKRFGPVVVSSFATEERTIDSGDPFYRTETVLLAQQDLAELRNERQAYRAALVLVSKLRRGTQEDVPTIQSCICEICERVSNWPNQWDRERRWRIKVEGYYNNRPLWNFRQDNLRRIEISKHMAMMETSEPPRLSIFGSDPITSGHEIICELVNAFSPLVYAWGESPIEAPDSDVAGGIRPVLYYILRREYLLSGGIAVCRNIQCRELFEIERAGQEFCGDLCSRTQRQREYWKNRGKKLRKRRLKLAAPVPATKSHSKRKDRK